MPKAPKLLGALVGLGIAENAVPAGKLADLYGKVEDTEARRQGVAEALLYVKASAPSLSFAMIDPRRALQPGWARMLRVGVTSGGHSIPGRDPFNTNVQDQPGCFSAPYHRRAVWRRVMLDCKGLCPVQRRRIGELAYDDCRVCAVQGKVGEAKLEQLCKDGDLHVGELFKADPEFDPEDIPDAAAFLKEQGLSVVPL